MNGISGILTGGVPYVPLCRCYLSVLPSMISGQAPLGGRPDLAGGAYYGGRGII